MKKFIGFILSAAIVVALLTGCGSSTPPASGGDTNAPTDSTAPSTANENNTVVIAVATDLLTLDPGKVYEVYGNMYTYSVYDMLYRMDASDMSKPQPSLATSYTVDDSQTVYTFTLRNDVKFSSGNPLTSADVVWSIQRVMNLASNATVDTANIASVQAIDPSTVQLTLKSPDASLFAMLACNAFAVLDSQTVEANGGTDGPDAATADTAETWLNNHSAGSGAYMLESWTPGTQLVLDANPNYWGTKSNISKIIIQETKDVNTQIQKLKSGDVDAALDLSYNNIPQIQDTQGITIKEAQTALTTFLMMNDDPTIGGPMANSKVQQAVRYAIDYNGLVTLAGDGSTVPMNIVPMGMVGALTRDLNFRDVDKAKQLLTEAGYPNGFSVDLTVASDNDSEGMPWTTIAQKVQSDLKDVGITVNIQSQTASVVYDAMRQGQMAFYLMYWSPDYYDINNQFQFLPGSDDNSTLAYVRLHWASDADNAQLNDLANQIKSELDYNTRANLSQQLQNAYDQYAPYVFLLQHAKTYAVSDNLQNVKYNDICKLQLTDLTLAGN